MKGCDFIETKAVLSGSGLLCCRRLLRYVSGGGSFVRHAEGELCNVAPLRFV